MFRPILALALAAGLAPAAATQTPPPELSLPIACTIGRTCELQNHVDRDPGPGARDYRCGT
ncbi:MAG: M23 family peptidase, partial [Dehalococcoidia bacterium]|nr:M23 family peptidase [Dehalococcoidia bacterium]